MAQNTHTEEFTCDICGASYDSVTDLDRHKQQHSRIAKREEEEQQDFRGDIGAAGMPTAPRQ